MAGTTLKKLTNSRCYCMIKSKDIPLKECKLFNCSRWKSCRKKTNNDISKDMKKQEKG